MAMTMEMLARGKLIQKHHRLAHEIFERQDQQLCCSYDAPGDILREQPADERPETVGDCNNGFIDALIFPSVLQ